MSHFWGNLSNKFDPISDPLDLMDNALALGAKLFGGDVRGIILRPTAKIFHGLIVFTNHGDDVRTSKSANLSRKAVDVFEMFGFVHIKTPSRFPPNGE